MNNLGPRWAQEITARFPHSWDSTTVGQLGQLISGSTPPRSRQDRYFAGHIRWVKTGDLTNADVLDTEERITQDAVRECRCTVHPPGTVLVAMYGGFQQIGRTGLLRIEAATNQAITAIRLSATSRVTPEFLQAWLNHEKSAWRRIAGSSRKDPNIAKSDISVFPVPIPPRKICGSLDAAIAFSDRAVQLLDQALHAKRAFKRGLMQQLLTGRMRFPEFRDRPWSTERFDRLCEEITERNGKMLGKDSVMGVIKGVGFEPMRARVRGRGELARYKVVPPGAFAYNPMRLNIGSIAYNCLGSPILVSPDYEVFRAKEGIADPAYVNQLRYSAPWSSFMKRAGAGSVRIRIYFADLSRLRVPAPSMGEQTRLANVLDLCDAEVDLLAAQRVQMKREKHALLSRVLFGDSR